MSPNSERLRKTKSLKQSDAGIRPFRRGDLAEVVNLMEKMFPRSPEATLELKKDILTELLLNNPWHDDRLPSLVYKNSDGKITGFLGVAPRPMKINNRSVSAAISYNLMVDPESRASLAGISLVKTFLEGPQDISIADSATDTSRQLWERLGGTTIPLYSIYWKHPLRPTSFATHHLGKRKYLKLISKVATPVCRLTDRMIDSFWNGRESRGSGGKYTSQEITYNKLVQHIERFSSEKSLEPVYTGETLGWLLDLAAKPKRFGELKKEVVHDDKDNFAGWFIYYKNPGGVSEVLQIKSVPGKEKRILVHLLQRAKEQGAVGVAGRLDPEWFTVVPNTAFCFYMPGRVWMLAHTDDGEILRAFREGDAWISRLEGDLWLI